MKFQDISPLFFCKFFVLLFMEGRGIDGEIIEGRDKLINREDSYLIYHYLVYVATTEDNISDYELLDDTTSDEYLTYGMNFLDQLPEEFELYSPKQVMENINKKTECVHPMFAETTSGDVEEIDSGSEEDKNSDSEEDAKKVISNFKF